MIQSSFGAAGTGTVDVDLCDLGVVVLDQNGRAASANACARELLRADSDAVLDDRLRDLGHALSFIPGLDGGSDETPVEVPGAGSIGVRRFVMSGANASACVLLLRDARSLTNTGSLLQQAARYRGFVFLARDWAHDLKGMLHVIRINCALLARLLQRQSPAMDSPVAKCLDAIPREVERLDRSIDLMLGPRPRKQSTVDVGVVCERLRNLVAARALRQRVDVVVELKGGSKEVAGVEEQVQSAILNVIVNALEAMPDEGRLVIAVTGDDGAVTVRVTDNGRGMQPQLAGRLWRPHFVNDWRQTAIGLHVTRTIIESHRGRVECASNVPRGTCVEITLPPAASAGI
jgi:signal transduction histidine kinase